MKHRKGRLRHRKTGVINVRHAMKHAGHGARYARPDTR